MKVNERIKQRREELGLSADDIAKALNISRATVYRYESNEIKKLPTSTLEPLAKVLQTTPAYLMGWEDKKQTDFDELAKYGIKPIQRKKFPMLGEIACGQPITCNEDFETFIEANADINADFCLTAKGDSMINARIYNGDVVFIREQPEVENGEIAAVIINDEATLKRVYVKSESIILRPENPLYDDIVYEKEEMDNVRILGKAVAFLSIIR